MGRAKLLQAKSTFPFVSSNLDNPKYHYYMMD